LRQIRSVASGFGTLFAFMFRAAPEKGKRPTIMLRVTQPSAGEAGAILKLEGKLIQPWVDEIQGLLNEGKFSTGARLDLSGLTFIDEAGTTLIRHLLSQGFQIESCSPYVAELLQWRRDQNR